MITQNKAIKFDFMVRCPDFSVLGYETIEIKRVKNRYYYLQGKRNSQ